MAYTTSERTNILQNQEDYILPLNQPIIFNRKLFTKTLDPIQEDPTKPRTVTIKYTYKNCK
jgi:hypothetical protein